jgi:hypothetical protein
MKPVLALISLFFIASCASSGWRSRASLVGNWRYADKTQICQYSFKSDGFFAGEVKYNSKVVSKFTGLWTLKGDALFYTYIHDAFGRIPAGTTDRDRLLEVKKDSFLIQAANGDRRRYSRIK